MLSLEAIAAEYPEHLRSFPRNLLREYLQCKVLGILFGSPISAKLSFLGGTALCIVHGNPRFSEALDFDNRDLSFEEFQTLAKLVKKSLELEGFLTEIDTVFKKAFRCYLKFPRLLFENGLSPVSEEKLLIQLDSQGHDFSYEPEKVILNKFDVFTQIRVTPLPLLLSQKIGAFLGRRRTMGRDIFDIIFLLSKTRPNYAYLKQKLGIDQPEMLRKELLEKCRALHFEALAKDVAPFLFREGDQNRILSFPEFIKTTPLS